MNLGAGKNFNFGKNWGIQLSAHINPSVLFSAKGRTLNVAESIVDLERSSTSYNLFLSADAGVDFFFKVGKSRILAGADFKQSLSKIFLLENSDLQLQPQIISFKLGVERKF